MGLELVGGLQGSLELEVVVDLAVDCEDDLAVSAHERLGTSVCGNLEMGRKSALHSCI